MSTLVIDGIKPKGYLPSAETCTRSGSAGPLDSTPTTGLVYWCNRENLNFSPLFCRDMTTLNDQLLVLVPRLLMTFAHINEFVSGWIICNGGSWEGFGCQQSSLVQLLVSSKDTGLKCNLPLASSFKSSSCEKCQMTSECLHHPCLQFSLAFGWTSSLQISDRSFLLLFMNLSKKQKFRACDQCRKKKSKCDAKSTDSVCSSCLQSNKPCTYLLVLFLLPIQIAHLLPWQWRLKAPRASQGVSLILYPLVAFLHLPATSLVSKTG